MYMYMDTYLMMMMSNVWQGIKSSSAGTAFFWALQYVLAKNHLYSLLHCDDPAQPVSLKKMLELFGSWQHPISHQQNT